MLGENAASKGSSLSEGKAKGPAGVLKQGRASGNESSGETGEVGRARPKRDF